MTLHYEMMSQMRERLGARSAFIKMGFYHPFVKVSGVRTLWEAVQVRQSVRMSHVKCDVEQHLGIEVSVLDES